MALLDSSKRCGLSTYWLLYSLNNYFYETLTLSQALSHVRNAWRMRHYQCAWPHAAYRLPPEISFMSLLRNWCLVEIWECPSPAPSFHASPLKQARTPSHPYPPRVCTTIKSALRNLKRPSEPHWACDLKACSCQLQLLRYSTSKCNIKRKVIKI